MYTLFVTKISTGSPRITREFDNLLETASYIANLHEFKEDIPFKPEEHTFFVRDMETSELYEWKTDRLHLMAKTGPHDK